MILVTFFEMVDRFAQRNILILADISFSLRLFFGEEHVTFACPKALRGSLWSLRRSREREIAERWPEKVTWLKFQWVPTGRLKLSKAFPIRLKEGIERARCRLRTWKSPRLRTWKSLRVSDVWHLVAGSGYNTSVRNTKYIYPGIPTTIKTMGVNVTTIAYLRVLIIGIGSTSLLMVVEAQGIYTTKSGFRNTK